MKRREARERLMQLLFEMDAQEDFSIEMKDKFLAQYMPEDTADCYFQCIFDAVTNHREELDRILEGASDKWKIRRFSKVDLAILRLSAAEIFYCSEVPDSVSINEAVEMAKKYGGEDSPRFINGILGRLAKDKNEQAGTVD